VLRIQKQLFLSRIGCDFDETGFGFGSKFESVGGFFQIFVSNFLRYGTYVVATGSTLGTGTVHFCFTFFNIFVNVPICQTET